MADKSEGQKKDKDDEKVSIKVNGKTVKIRGKKHTGLEIKQAAIEQGVEIQLGFHLTVQTEKGGWKPIPNDQEIELNEHHRVFRAVDGDDNS